MLIERIQTYLRQRDNRLNHSERPFTLEYWLDLPTRFPKVAEELRPGNCSGWSYAAFDALVVDGYNGIYRYGAIQSQFNDDDWLWNEMGVWGHVWLNSEWNGRLYIADGTAGQFFKDDQLVKGYYGYLEDAPSRLQQVYLH